MVQLVLLVDNAVSEHYQPDLAKNLVVSDFLNRNKTSHQQFADLICNKLQSDNVNVLQSALELYYIVMKNATPNLVLYCASSEVVRNIVDIYLDVPQGPLKDRALSILEEFGNDPSLYEFQQALKNLSEQVDHDVGIVDSIVPAPAPADRHFKLRADMNVLQSWVAQVLDFIQNGVAAPNHPEFRKLVGFLEQSTSRLESIINTSKDEQILDQALSLIEGVSSALSRARPYEIGIPESIHAQALAYETAKQRSSGSLVPVVAVGAAGGVVAAYEPERPLTSTSIGSTASVGGFPTGTFSY